MARIPRLIYVLSWISCVPWVGLSGCQHAPPTSDYFPPLMLDAPRVDRPTIKLTRAATMLDDREGLLSPPAMLMSNASVSLATALPGADAAASAAKDDPPAARLAVPAQWAPNVPVRDWQWIVIHHTATTFGNAQMIDAWHRDRGFDELGYHFVIGNGTNSGDGQIEVGPRWTKQKWGAHTKTADNRFNDYGIGICLVGNFDEQRPSAAQWRAVATLVAYLMKTYHIAPDRVLGHGDAKPTDCPGKFLSVADIRGLARRELAMEDIAPDRTSLAANNELLISTPSK